jgi:transposase
MSKKYTLEFKQEAVKLVTERGYTQAEAGRSLGISSKNINRWLLEGVKPAADKLKENLSSEQQEIQRLRKENERLKMEKEILKKAAAFFANEKS